MRPDVVSSAEDLPFEDGSFDVVTCRIAAHHFQDVRKAVAEMARVTQRLLVIEDNGIGISVRTPPGWVRAAAGSVPGFGYFHADGSDLAAVYDAALAASAWVRERRSPAFLHLAVVRFGGHAGSDVESSYRGTAAAADLAADPLIGTARLLVTAGILLSLIHI